MDYRDLQNKELSGKVWYMPTDTIPGISALVDDVESIDRITKLKQRPNNKMGFIVLMSSIHDLEQFNVHLDEKQRQCAQKLWPGSYSIIFTQENTTHTHLTKNGEPIAFRVPDNSALVTLLKKIGPVVSTSLNISGEEAIVDATEAEEKFGNKIHYYLETDHATNNQSSTLIKIIR